jgi:hypothetical protein
MSIVVKMRKQYAVLWDNPVADGYGGHTFDAPIQIRCRWDDEQTLVLDENGNEVVSGATVYPDTTPTKGTDGWGYMYEGTLASITGVNTDPRAVDGSRKILTVGKVPSLKNKAKKLLRIVKLK